MGWSLGFDTNWSRDIGYGVPAICDHPDCVEEIDRGLAYVCSGQEPYGGNGCGLYFCEKHRDLVTGECERCECGGEPFTPSEDSQKWKDHKRTDPSWDKWREDNPKKAAKL